MLPSSIYGRTTETVGLFRCDTGQLAQWLVKSLGQEWVARSAPATASLESLCRMLSPGGQLSRHALIPWGEWTAMLTDGPLGTDPGMIPSLAAREIGCTGIRATATDPQSDGFPAVVLEVFDPEATADLLRHRRSIEAADDGGRWTFGQAGAPFEFEDVSAYARRRIRDRFTPTMLTDYLRALGVPIEADLELAGAIVVEKV